MILSTIVVTFHGLNCYGHMIYALQTGTYKKHCKTLDSPKNKMDEGSVGILKKKCLVMCIRKKKVVGWFCFMEHQS